MSNVLCPQLYNKLLQLFGSVKVAANLSPMVWNPRYDNYQRFDLNVIDGGEYYRVCCPFCNDQKYRLWINHMYGQFVPQLNQRINWLCHCYNETACMQSRENRRTLLDRVYGFENMRNRGQSFVVLPSPGPVKPRGFVSPGLTVSISKLPEYHPTRQYILNTRGYSLEMCDKYGIQCCVTPSSDFEGLLQDWLIFPIHQGGKLVGWQGRVNSDHFTGPKYFSMPSMKKSHLLYNIDSAARCPFVVVVEGVTDVHRVGDYAVGTFGCDLSHTQQSLLEIYWRNKPIVFMWDPEAVAGEGPAGLRTTQVLQRFAAVRTGPLVIVRLPLGTDPGSLPTDVIWGYIKQQASESNVFLYN